MAVSNIIKVLSRNITNFPGWTTNRKIVVIESDDWGSIRMPSKTIYKELVNRGIRVDKLPYNKFDSLASEDDLSFLFEVLTSVRDKNGNPAIFTMNTIVANPDFEKIRETDFQEYFYEPFTKTLRRYPDHLKSFGLWQKGIEAGVCMPQFHGREHLNVFRWLKTLRKNVGNVRLAFDYGMYDLSEGIEVTENSYMETFNLESPVEYEFQKMSIVEGTKLFKDIFGFKSKTFIAPCYIWSRKLNQTFWENGIEAFQGNWFQKEPIDGDERKFKKIFHYIGQRNNLNQYYLIRNVYFEPSENPDYNWIDDSLARIRIAFYWRKPAIISSHRMNYIGFIDPDNRSRNLPLLRKLLNEILKRWPETEFMSTDQLYHLISVGK